MSWEGTEAQGYMGRGGALRWVIRKVAPRNVSQQAQNGQGHEMVESVERQIARAVVGGGPAHQAAAPAAAAGTDRTASNAPAQDGERSGNKRGMRRDLENGPPRRMEKQSSKTSKTCI